MKKIVSLFVLLFVGFSLNACSKVPAGNVGVKVHLLGSSKGIDSEELGPGRYWIGPNEDLFIFPTFTQNYVWTKDKNEGSQNDESITFQTQEGMDVNADVGIAYHIDKLSVNKVFQKYRKGVGEITDIFLRNIVRDAFNQAGSTRKVEAIYGQGKTDFISSVEELVKNQVGEIGIIVEKISLVGSMRLPTQVIRALNEKIAATQRAQQRENELREAQAEAQKKIAQAKGEADSILLKAESQAKANLIIAKSLTKELVQYESIKKWDGMLPKFTGNNIPLIQINEEK